jgi:malonate transporter and related proteins
MEVFEAVFPIVAIAALGFLMRRQNILAESDSAGLERFTFTYLMPALLFTGGATASLPDNLDWHYLLAFYLAVFIVYLLGVLIARLAHGYGVVAQSVFGMGGAYSNVTVLGVPICVELLGEEAFLPMLVIISVHNMVIYAFGTLLAERRTETGVTLLGHIWKVARDMLKNPISGSLVAGLLVNLLGVPIYQPLMEAMGLLSRAAVPAALFVVGAALTRYRIRGELTPALIITLLKLLVLPLTVWILMYQVFNIEPLWAATGVMLACMPVGISVYVFAKRYESCEPQVAGAIVLSSLLAVPVISIVAWLLTP